MEIAGRTQDGNGDGSGDGTESNSGDGNRDEDGNGNGNKDMIGEGSAEERRRSARNRTRLVDAMYEIGETGWKEEKT